MSSEFDQATIGDLAVLVKDGTHGTHPRVASGIPFLSAKNITSDGVVRWDGDDFFISEAEYRAIHRTFQLEVDDLLLTVVGSLGRRALHDGSRVTFQRSVAYVRPDRTQAFPRYLFHATAADGYQRQLVQRSNATAQAGLYLGELAATKVALPPLPEQRCIAEILDTLDEAIRKTEQVIAKLQQMKQGLLHDLLTRGIDEHGELRDPDRHPEQFKPSPLGRIPREWKLSNLGAQFTLQRGFDITVAEQRPGPYPVVSSSGITSFHERAMVPGPGVVTGRKGKLGDAYYLDGPFWPHDTSLWVKNFHGNLPKYGALFLRWLRLERFDAATSVPTLNRNFVHPLTVAIPPVSEQHRIVDAAQGTDARIQFETAQLAKLHTIKQGLMDDLLTGRVRVGSAAEASP